ncbi:MAG: hypothetical protein U9Q78_03535 [Chloroflexota bacterium]|nr:hypothetical protein [Chloroflexota bacterium]
MATTKQAVAGKRCSGVIVATMIRSRSAGSKAPFFSACRAASLANEAVVSPSSAMRRSWMPVRSLIHPSEVSTMRLRSSLVSTRSGSAFPSR